MVQIQFLLNYSIIWICYLNMVYLYICNRRKNLSFQDLSIDLQKGLIITRTITEVDLSNRKIRNVIISTIFVAHYFKITYRAHKIIWATCFDLNHWNKDLGVRHTSPHYDKHLCWFILKNPFMHDKVIKQTWKYVNDR